MAGYPYQATLGHRERDAHVSGYETVLCTYEDETEQSSYEASLRDYEAAFQAYEDFRVFCDFCETSTKTKTGILVVFPYLRDWGKGVTVRGLLPLRVSLVPGAGCCGCARSFAGS